MKLKFLLILIVIIPFHAKSDQIYELIKIPNLKLYDSDKNGLRYFVPDKNFSAGLGINSVSCQKIDEGKLKKKFQLIQKNTAIYEREFLKKINLKFIVFCKNLTVSEIPAIGFANPEMKTIILNVNSKEKIFQRVIHHEIFHVIHFNFKKFFDNKKWEKFNDSKFNYSLCLNCEKDDGLKPLKKINGFFTGYAKTSVSEDMAETFSFLILYKNYSLKKIKTDEILKKKVDFIKENILNIYQDFDFK
tara:strand:+ start:341 stop:1078 length:738 start_codon:yes stop_codon:yes gene_type:complete